MALPSSIVTAINNAVSKIKAQIQHDIETHSGSTGSSSNFGHVKAGGAPQDIDTTGTSASGTDNGYYARADHKHKIATASTTGKGIVQLDSTPTANSNNAITSDAVKTAITSLENGASGTISGSISTHNSDSSAHSTEMNKKVDKAQGSTNANKNVVTDSNGNITTEAKLIIGTGATNAAAGNHTHSNYLTTHQDISGKANTADLATVATSGSYNDLTNKPTIPSAVTVDSSLSTTSTNPVQNKVINTALSDKASSTHTHGNVQNDGTVKVSSTVQKSKNLVTDANGYVNVEDKITKTSQLTNDGDGSNAFIKEGDSRLTNARTPTSHTHDDRYYTESEIDTKLSSKVDTVSGKGLSTNDFSATYKDYVDNLVSSSATTKNAHTHTKSQITDFPTLSTVATSGSYNDLTNKPSLSSLGGAVTIEKATSNIDGNLARYTIKQNGEAITNGVIDIPKDFLVKSGAVHTVGGNATGDKTASQLGTGYSTGDKYIDFVINTKGNDGTDEHIYINVKDLVDSTVTISRDLTSGTKIGTITINGVSTDLYCETNTTYSNATTNAAGLMSADDKTKLNGIATGANNYSHPSQSLGTLPSSATLKKIKYDANGHITATANVSGPDLPEHIHFVNQILNTTGDPFYDESTGLHVLMDGAIYFDTTNSSRPKLFDDNCEIATLNDIPDTSNYLTNHQTLKTINNTSLVGTGNISVVTDVSGKEDASNKVTSSTGISSSSTDTQYPSAKAVYSYAQPVGNYLTQHQDISGKEDASNKIINISSSSTDTQYPSAKATYDAIDNVLDNIILQLRS